MCSMVAHPGQGRGIHDLKDHSGMIARSMSAEDFVERRYDLADGGQWAELIAGQAVELNPPEGEHGNAVLNLTRALADWVEESRCGYACFELGLIIARNPDSVFCPPVSYFVDGNRWEEMDKALTETRPALVVEVPSTPDRVRLQTDRVSQYHAWGVALVWVVEPAQRRITVHVKDQDRVVLTDGDRLSSADDWTTGSKSTPILPGFTVAVADVFRAPDWWTGKSRPGSK